MKRTLIYSLAFLSLTILIGKFGVIRDVNAETFKAAEIVDFDSGRWEIKDPTAKKEEHLGRKSLFLSANGYAALKDVEFEDGIVEVDIAASTSVAFPGVVFRYLSPAEHELVYIRPHHSGHDDGRSITAREPPLPSRFRATNGST
jgi:hypothetical protein